ncbi:MAG: outer membrane beta-barrel family protein, partial [Bacteroidota bacterium]
GRLIGISIWGSANAGMMYLFSNSKKLTVTWTPSLNNYSYDYNGIGSSRMGDITREREANNSNSEYSYFSNGGTISYRDNPEDDSKEFSIEASYSRQGNNSKSLNKNTYSIYNFHAFEPDSIALVNQPTDETSDEFSFEVYNRKNIDSTGRWEVGAEIEGTHTVKESKYLFNNIFKDEFSRSEESLGMMSAVYGNYGTKKKKWKFDAGIRLALGSINYDVYANYSGKDTTLQVERYVPMILPSLSVGYEIKPMHELKVSYSYDVQEPQIYQLDPYINRSEPRAISSGNSQLDPYRFHRFTFGYMFSPGPYSLSLDAFTNYSNNYVDDVVETLNSFVVYKKPYNVGKLTQSGLTLSASGMPVQWFNANVSFDVFRSTLDATQLTAELQTMPVTTSGLVTTNWTVSGNFYMNIIIKKKYNLSMYMNNGGRNTSIGGYNKGGMYSNISLSRKFFNRMLNVSIGVQNVIDKWASYDYSQSYLGRTSTNSWESSWGRRSFRLSLRWYFNKGDRGTMSNQGAPQGGGPGGKK